MRSELLLAPGAGEESPLIVDKLGKNFENSHDLGLKKLHAFGVIVRAAGTFWPWRRFIRPSAQSSACRALRLSRPPVRLPRSGPLGRSFLLCLCPSLRYDPVAPALETSYHL